MLYRARNIFFVLDYVFRRICWVKAHNQNAAHVFVVQKQATELSIVHQLYTVLELLLQRNRKQFFLLYLKLETSNINHFQNLVELDQIPIETYAPLVNQHICVRNHSIQRMTNIKVRDMKRWLVLKAEKVLCLSEWSRFILDCELQLLLLPLGHFFHFLDLKRLLAVKQRLQNVWRVEFNILLFLENSVFWICQGWRLTAKYHMNPARYVRVVLKCGPVLNKLVITQVKLRKRE